MKLLGGSQAVEGDSQRHLEESKAACRGYLLRGKGRSKNCRRVLPVKKGYVVAEGSNNLGISMER